MMRCFLLPVILGSVWIGSCYHSALAIPLSNVYINFAGAGGHSTIRAATLRASEATTTTEIQGQLRLYDAHIARMIEATQAFCQEQNRPPSFTVHWNYEAEDGKIFMGRFPLTCEFANNTFQSFGSGKQERVVVHHRGNAQAQMIETLNLQGEKLTDFLTIVDHLKPQCIEGGSCPGDRLE